MSRKRTLTRTAVVAAGAALGLWALLAVAPGMMNDFVEYWAAGSLNLSGRNPYDPALMLQAERAAGFERDRVLMMLNPPLILTFVMPLSFLPYREAAVVWLAINLIALGVSCVLLWRLAGGRTGTAWFAVACGIVFVPSLFALFLGQSSILLLLGLSLFLWFERESRLLTAGAVSTLLLVKPHVVYLVGVAFFALWLRNRDWRFVAGAGLAIGFLALVPLAFNPEVYAQYLEMYRTESLSRFAPSTLGSLLRLAAGDPSRFGLQFLPMVLGLAYLATRLRRRRSREWDWGVEMPGLVVVSVATAAYGWVFDQVVLLVAALPMFAVALRAGGARLARMTAFWVVTGVILFVQAFSGVNSMWYFWLPHAYLAALLLIGPAMPDREGCVAVDGDHEPGMRNAPGH